jgi:para-nitrobenzyl esterase
MSKVIIPILGSVLVLSACNGQSEQTSSSPIGEVVQTAQGAVRGEVVTTDGATAYIYRGIPYAAAPVGDLRWAAPQPVAAWEGERDATQWPNRCPQGASSMGTGAPINEDCLYLNVVTAAEGADASLPVIVFFHGGGLTSGTSSSTTYNHPKLPNQGVVTVTVNSRLGPIGYLAHPDLEEGSGNFGTLDLRASLEWIQENIAAFGGDPGRVTIMGESGGGSKVISQMASPGSHGLFHGAIVESGSGLATSENATTIEEAEEMGVALGVALGAEAGQGQLAAMRAASWEDVLAAGPEAGFRATPAVGGDVIPAPVREMFENGEQAKVPLIVGANTGEGSLRTSVPGMANLHSASGAPTYVYNFSQLPSGWRAEEGCVAFHGLELTYVFGAIPEGLSSPTTQGLARGGGCTSRLSEHDDQDMKVADEASKVWASFADDGNPSVEGLIEWPQYTEENNVYLDIGTPLQVKDGIENAYIAPPENEEEDEG